jgi:hypothetical protein
MRQMEITYQPRTAGTTLAPRAAAKRRGRRGGSPVARLWYLLALLALIIGGRLVIGHLAGGGGGSNPPNTAQVRAEEAYAQQVSGNSPGQQQCLIWLWNRESAWDPAAANPTSDARGIAQNINGWGPGYTPGDWQGQIQWGLNYIDHTSTQGPGGTPYGSPCAAWNHEETAGWY